MTVMMLATSATHLQTYQMGGGLAHSAPSAHVPMYITQCERKWERQQEPSEPPCGPESTPSKTRTPPGPHLGTRLLSSNSTRMSLPTLSPTAMYPVVPVMVYSASAVPNATRTTFFIVVSDGGGSRIVCWIWDGGGFRAGLIGAMALAGRPR